MLRATVVIAGTAAALCGLLPASAAAAPLGSLSFQECFDGLGAPNPCGPGHEAGGLSFQARPVAVSPDGQDVYAASRSPGGLVHFDRAPDGTLTPAECFADDSAAGMPCGATNDLLALSGATGITINADGTDVYVTTEFDDAVLHFTRAAEGTLTYQECVDDLGGADPCGAGQQVEGLDGALYSDLSPNGSQLYVTGFTLTGVDGFLVVLPVRGDGSFDVGGSICFNSTVTPAIPCGVANEVDGLMNAVGVSVAPDGENVYVTGHFDNTVVTFDRDGSGVLTNPSCISDVGDPTCPTNAEGLLEATFVEVSPDSRNVYITGRVDSAVVTFDRAPDGSLVNARCVGDIGVPSGCAVVAQGLAGARSISLSPDGEHAYVPGELDDAINFFDRAADGSLIWRSCIDNAGGPATCGTEAPGLDEVFFAAVAPDGISVYTGASTSNAVGVFDRELPPRCRGSASFGEPGQTQTVALDCSDPNGDALSFEVLDSPDSGVLGVFDAAAGTVPYTPNPGFSGLDSFDVRATANGLQSEVVTLTVLVQSATGPQGPQGEPGPAGEAATKLFLAVASPRVSARSGRRVRLNYVATAAADVTLEVLKGTRVVATIRGEAQPGRNRIAWNGKIRRKPAKPGRYTLELTATTADGQEATDRARLRVARRTR